MNNIKIIKEWVILKNDYRKLFIYLIILGGIYVLPIVLADRYYNDDLARSLYGYTGWGGDVRPITEKLTLFLCGGKIAADIAPLPMILSVLFFAYSLTIYAKERLIGLKKDFIMAYGLIKVVYMPFLLYMLMFKYDCGPELWSLCVCLLWAALPLELPTIIYGVISVLSAVIVMCTYQPSVGMFLVLTAIDFFLYFINQEKLDDIKKKIMGLFSLGVGLLIYVFIIVKNYKFDEGDWRVAQTKFAMSSDNPILLIKGNIHTFLRLGYEHLAGYPKIYKIACFGSIVLVMLVATRCIWKISIPVWRKVCATSILMISPLAMVGLSICPMIFSQDLNMTVRLLVSISGYSLFIGILYMIIAQRYRWLSTILIMVCMIFQISYVYALGNAISCQKEYEKYLVYEMAKDIENISTYSDSESLIVSIIGNTPYASETKTILDNYPNMEMLVPRYITNNWWLGGAWLQRYVSKNIIYKYSEKSFDEIKNEEYFNANSVYSVYLIDDIIYIVYNC